MPDLYLLGRFVHFLGLLLWVSGLFVFLKSVRIFVRLQMRGVYSSEDAAPVLRPAYRFASHMGMGLAWLGGLAMLRTNVGLWQQGWMQAKLTLLLGLSLITVLEYRQALRWQRGGSPSVAPWMRLVDPLLILIVLLAVFRPF